MLAAIGEVAHRACVFFLLGLFPWSGRIEPGTSSAVSYLLVFILGTALLVFLVRTSARSYPFAAAITVALVFAVVIAPIGYAGDNGPLARGIVWFSPLVYSGIAAHAAARLPRRFRARVWIAAAGALAIALFAARGRLVGQAGLRRAALAEDPGYEPGALAVSRELDSEHDRKGAWDVLRSCAHARPSSCACALGAAEHALDAGAHADALTTLHLSDLSMPSAKCSETAAAHGMSAEALAGMGMLDGAISAADATLVLDPNDRHAVFAKAYVCELRGDHGCARTQAERAIELGRGSPAHLVLGLSFLGVGDLVHAKSAFEQALKEDEKSSRAAYDLALVAHKQGHYRDAREGYLHALVLDPSNTDARYNLVILTHENGFDPEARHHLELLASAAPADPRLPALQTLLASRQER